MIKFRLLGQFALLRGDAEVDLGPARQRCVLAMLLVHHHQPLPTDALIDRLWGDRPPQRAREALYVYVTRLRRVLRGLPAGVERQPGGYICRVDAAAIDLHRFTGLIAASATSPSLEEKVGVLREALALRHDEPLGGLSGEWVLRTRESLNRQWLSAVLACHEAELALGRHEALVPALSELVAAHPLVEPLVGQLMLALHRCGRHVEALAAFRRTRGLLVQEQGLEPGPALRELERAILTNDASLDPPAGAGESTASPVKPVRSSLPRRSAHFVGRHTELAALDELSRQPRPGPALGVLSGVGGAGKTALALHWAHQRSAQFPDGLHYLDLQGICAEKQLLRLLGVGDADIPDDPVARQGLLRATLTGRRLLILDNAVSAEQVRALLGSDEGVMILALSRKRLRGLAVHEGATLVHIGPMAAGDATGLLRVLAKAGTDPQPQDKLARLAQLCDHLPLALRIVGCRLAEDDGITIDALLAELSPEEQRLSALEIDGDDSGVRAAFAASLRWAGERPARLFRFLGTFPASGVSAACLSWAMATHRAEIVALLDVLLRHQLVYQDGQGLYRMHDLVRLYAREQAMGAETEADRCHALRGLASWYLDTAIRACHAVTPGPPRDRRHFIEPRFEPMRFATAQDAMQWFDRERDSLAATVRTLHGLGWHDLTAPLAEALLTLTSARPETRFCRWPRRGPSTVTGLVG